MCSRKERLLLLGSEFAVAAFFAADFAAATGFEGHAVFLILAQKGARIRLLRRTCIQRSRAKPHASHSVSHFIVLNQRNTVNSI